jgi:hypothetical protein
LTECKKKNYQIYCWCCDFYSNTGEGKLALLFLDYLLKVVKKIEIGTYKKKFYFESQNSKKFFEISKKINFNLFWKYVLPFFGIFMLWINYFKNKKLFYINYLPLWNIFIFLLVPPKTNFGPITGSLYVGKVNNLNTFIRKYIFYFLYKISYFLLLLRKKKILFSTNNLYYLNKDIKYKKNIFNFQILYLYNKKIIKVKKDIDFLIYYREHINKNYNYLKKILSQNNFIKNYCIGNNFSFKNVNNLGVINHTKAQNLLSKAKFTFVTSENFNSFYCMDSILNSVNIVLDKKYLNRNKSFFLNYLKFKKVSSFKSHSEKNYSYKVHYIDKKRLNLFHESMIIFFRNYFY